MNAEKMSSEERLVRLGSGLLSHLSHITEGLTCNQPHLPKQTQRATIMDIRKRLDWLVMIVDAPAASSPSQIPYATCAKKRLVEQEAFCVGAFEGLVSLKGQLRSSVSGQNCGRPLDPSY